MEELKITKPEDLPELLGEYGMGLMNAFPEITVVDWGVSQKVNYKLKIESIEKFHDDLMDKIKTDFKGKAAIIPMKAKLELTDLSAYKYKIRYLVLYIYKGFPPLWPTYFLKINLGFTKEHPIDLEEKVGEKKIEEISLTPEVVEENVVKATLQIEAAATLWASERFLTQYLNSLQAKIVTFYYTVLTLYKYKKELLDAYNEGFKKLWRSVLEFFEKHKV